MSKEAIHKTLFEDIYDFAGQLRDVNLAKGTSALHQCFTSKKR